MGEIREIDPKLGEMFKKARLKLKLTQEEVAELIDCHPQYYKNLENGKGMPSIQLFCTIVRTLKISADDYVYPNHNKENPVYQELLHLSGQCNDYQLSVLLATANALLGNDFDKIHNK